MAINNEKIAMHGNTKEIAYNDKTKYKHGKVFSTQWQSKQLAKLNADHKESYQQSWSSNIIPNQMKPYFEFSDEPIYRHHFN